MEQEIENLIRKSFAKDVEIKMLDRELDGIIISKEIMTEILRELTDTKEKECRFGHICTSSCGNDYDCPCMADHCCELSDEPCGEEDCELCFPKKVELDDELGKDNQLER